MIRARSSRGGFALLETLIAFVVFGVIFASVTAMTDSARRAFGTSNRNEELSSRARRTLGRIAQEFRPAGAETLVPNPVTDFGADGVAFTTPAGLVGNDIDWGPVMEIAFQYDPGEIDDGVDNDGDGLVDEGRVVFTRDVGGGAERTFVLASGVSELGEGEVLNGEDDDGDGVRDEAGFNAHRVGDVIVLRLTLVGMDGDSRIEKSVETSVRLRN